jgi:hypothetical protein
MEVELTGVFTLPYTLLRYQVGRGTGGEGSGHKRPGCGRSGDLATKSFPLFRVDWSRDAVVMPCPIMATYANHLLFRLITTPYFRIFRFADAADAWLGVAATLIFFQGFKLDWSRAVFLI